MKSHTAAFRLHGRTLAGSWIAAMATGFVLSAAAMDGAPATSAFFQTATPSQVPQTTSVSPDSPRWALQGQASVAEYQGRKSLFLDGGAAVLSDLEMRDGIIDVDVATPAIRGFFGIQFRIAKEGANAEWVYLRQHKSGLPDALQYTPVLNTGLNWQIYNGPGFTGAVDIPRDAWYHIRLEVAGAQA